MSTNERDTHFQGFAESLIRKIGCEADDYYAGYEETRKIIAQVAFDFAIHIISHLRECDPHAILPDEEQERAYWEREISQQVPDLIPWPKRKRK